MQASDAQVPPSLDEPSLPRAVQDPFKRDTSQGHPRAQRPTPVGYGKPSPSQARCCASRAHRGNPSVAGPPPTNFDALVGRAPVEDGARPKSHGHSREGWSAPGEGAIGSGRDLSALGTLSGWRGPELGGLMGPPLVGWDQD